MTPERWAEVKAVFQRALDAEASERVALLDRECGDAELRGEVESLLAAHESAGSFLSEESTLPARSALTTFASGSRPAAPSVFRKRCETCGALHEARLLVCPADGDVLVDDPEALVGTTLDDRYEIEALVGRGGFGAVYLARHALLRDKVAVKVLRRELSASPDLLKRFLREGRAARAVSHPNIVSIHDLRASDDGFAYLVMEFVEGRTLREELRSAGRFTRAEALEVLGPIAEALDAAHAQGVVHRDLKPENVMLSGPAGSRSVKVLDLGLAKLAEAREGARPDESDLTLPGQRMGSPRYMSPEQWAGREVDATTDVYSLGVIAYELVTGRAPFGGSSLEEIRRAHVDGPAPLPDDRGAAPAGWRRAIRKAMARDPRDRYATAGELVATLRSGAATDPRRRALARAAAVVVALALVAGGVSLWRGGRVAEVAPATPTPVVSAPGPAKPYAAMSDAERVAFVDESVRRVSVMMAGREYGIPPDVRAAITQQVDRYASRVGTGVRERGRREDLRFVIARGRASAPVIGAAFRELDLPPFVGLYIAMIESEFDEAARSSMGARGIFQMLPKTAESYGAAPETLDTLEGSAPLAARYIKDGTATFASDRMGVAMSVVAYNRGFKAVQTYLDEVVVLHEDEAEQRFWAMATNPYPDSPVAAESRRYMTLFFAAAVVGENPGAFEIDGGPLTAYAGR